MCTGHDRNIRIRGPGPALASVDGTSIVRKKKLLFLVQVAVVTPHRNRAIVARYTQRAKPLVTRTLKKTTSFPQCRASNVCLSKNSNRGNPKSVHLVYTFDCRFCNALQKNCD
uniref:(northern house mosquito) hypothetical protein n=1 Tax=Culex pipiens TaxID=7175 RepID=A0A8D8CR25_CULPI